MLLTGHFFLKNPPNLSTKSFLVLSLSKIRSKPTCNSKGQIQGDEEIDFTNGPKREGSEYLRTQARYRAKSKCSEDGGGLGRDVEL